MATWEPLLNIKGPQGEAGPPGNNAPDVVADWNATSGPSQILNKPPVIASGQTALEARQVISDSDTIHYLRGNGTYANFGDNARSAVLTSQMWYYTPVQAIDEPLLSGVDNKYHMPQVIGQLQAQITSLKYSPSIKTINGESLAGEGNISVGDVTLSTDQTITGTKTFSTTQQFDGGIKIGESSPNLKFKLITGTTHATGGNVILPTAVTRDAIKSVSILVDISGTKQPPFITTATYHYSFEVMAGGQIRVTTSAAATYALGRPVEVLIGYTS